jgi:hypothetical protein
MLDEAQNTIMSFIKGPVCRGQVALNVINDHFWVFFVDPNEVKLDHVEDFLASQTDNLEMPASTGNIYRPLSHWRRYSKQQTALLVAMDEYLSENFVGQRSVSLDLVWDGDGVNDNAALTVFRHFDSATVEKGLVGKPPKTAWLIGYELLERRRIWQCRASAGYPHLHGLPAHGGRGRVPVVVAARSESERKRVLVSGGARRCCEIHGVAAFRK